MSKSTVSSTSSSSSLSVPSVLAALAAAVMISAFHPLDAAMAFSTTTGGGGGGVYHRGWKEGVLEREKSSRHPRPSKRLRRESASSAVRIAGLQRREQGADTIATATTTTMTTTTALRMASSPSSFSRGKREDEIRRKIMKLKREGRLKKKNDRDARLEAELEGDEDCDGAEQGADVTLGKLRRQFQSLRDNPVAEEYADKIKAKLGKKARFLSDIGGSGSGSGDDDADDDNDDKTQTRQEEEERRPKRQARLGSLNESNAGDNTQQQQTSDEINVLEQKEEDPMYDSPDDSDDNEGTSSSEEDLLELVAQKLAEKEERERKQQLEQIRIASSSSSSSAATRAVKDEERELKKAGRGQTDDDPVMKALKYKQQLDKQKEGGGLEQQQQQQQQQPPLKQTTTGVGGTWAKNETVQEDSYKPSRGSWGAFPRPKDISKAYGGGRKVGAGVSVDESARAASVEETRARLQRYREKVGIDVQSEKDHAEEIDDAMQVAQYAMQRGLYSTAVKTLEQVTKYCGTNSPVGGKVFLELAMAYEAMGRTQEAITVYTTLTNCRIEEIKYNAKRLLYGIEAMNFMRNEARSPDFSRKKVTDTFVDATGLAHIAENFDKRYNTAYIDLDRGGGFYRKLTESVVRSNREARQILLKAVGSGEVERLKVVQALRSLSRNFDDALKEEMKKAQPEPEPVAVMNGKPIVPKRAQEEDLSKMLGIDRFILASPEQMLENLNGEWRLQLMADKKGDGVRYYNSTLSWQDVDTAAMQFKSFGPAGFLTVSQNGGIEFDKEKRIVSRSDVSTSGAGSMLTAIVGGSGANAAANSPQQIVSVDSVLLITRYAGKKKTTSDDNMKDYFSVWRRVERGTYSRPKRP